MAKQQTTIRIRLQAFENTILDQSVADIVGTVRRTGAQVAGPIPSRPKSNASP